MRLPNPVLPALAAASLLLAAAASAQAPKIPTGPWKDIFNGKDLAGWSHAANPPFTIANGILQTKGGSTKTYLIWNEPLKDMELQVKYRLSTSNANSGIQVRSRCADKSKAAPTCGGTYQVCGVQLDVAMSYSGRLFEECVGFLQFDGQNIDNCRRSLAVGQWMTTNARFDGSKVSLWMNGVHCLDYTLTNAEHLSNSVFALQSHDPFDLIEWEHVKIRKLNVPGCTDPKAANYNPEATKDDGSCQVSTAIGTGAARAAAAPRASAVRGAVRYELPAAGPFRLVLTDVRGAVVGERRGTGPLAGEMALPGQGLYFLETESAGVRSRQRLHSF